MLKTFEQVKNLDIDEFYDDYLIHIFRSDNYDSIVETIFDLVDADYHTELQDIDDFRITYNSEEYFVPVTDTNCDIFIVLSSVAYLLKDKFDFWLVKESLEDECFSLFVLDKASSKQLITADCILHKNTCIPLEIGYDYYYETKVPYIHHEDNNPNLQNDVKRFDGELNLFLELMEKEIKGN